MVTIHSGRTCEDLTIRNGAVNTDLGVSIEGAIATYTCNSEYELNTTSNLSRVCQSNGQWNGTDPTCIGKDLLSLVKGREWMGCIHIQPQH